MMSYIKKTMKDIRDSGYIILTSDFGNNQKHSVIAILAVQFIIGDCEFNNILCGRKGRHSLA